MRPQRLFWRIFLPYVLVTCGALLAVVWSASATQRAFWLEQTRNVLENYAHLAARNIPKLAPETTRDLDRLCKELGARTGVRYTVILPGGVVLGDSEEDASLMENHADRPEIRQALAGSAGGSKRFSRTIGEMLMYVAVPVEQNGSIDGVMRTSVPLPFIDQALGGLRQAIVLAGIVIAVAAAAVSLVISHRISRPLVALKDGAERFAGGDLSHKVPVESAGEVGALAHAMNEMSEQLDERLGTVVEQRNELSAVLSSMSEGVFAVDGEGVTISMNEAAARLLGVSQDAVTGVAIQGLVRNTELQDLVSRLLEDVQDIEGAVTLLDTEERHVQVHGTPLLDHEGQSMGAVLVLNDITRLRRLEDHRREFVANVSHELRTPITAVQGFVETLLDGALSDPEKARDFLDIIGRHAERLNAIIEDLLSLSRIEQDESFATPVMEDTDLVKAVQSAVQACEALAEQQNVRLESETVPNARIQANGVLLEQAVVNLIDNAVKYSNPGGTVRIVLERGDGGLCIRVSDTGCGIDEEHLPRIFERFHRVDKARSRRLGGTGLGLAIVKHVAQVHGGQVTVESVPGKGSTFTIRLPEEGA